MNAWEVKHFNELFSELRDRSSDPDATVQATWVATLLRWAAVEAAQPAGRESNPWHQLYADVAKSSGKNGTKSAVARKVLIASWHIRSREQPFKPSRPQDRAKTAPASSIGVLAA